MSNEPLYLRCQCYTPYHALVLDWDEDVSGTLNVQFVAESNWSFWHRVKWALHHIFKRQMLVEADLLLAEQDVRRLREFLSEDLAPIREA